MFFASNIALSSVKGKLSSSDLQSHNVAFPTVPFSILHEIDQQNAINAEISGVTQEVKWKQMKNESWIGLVHDLRCYFRTRL